MVTQLKAQIESQKVELEAAAAASLEKAEEAFTKQLTEMQTLLADYQTQVGFPIPFPSPLPFALTHTRSHTVFLAGLGVQLFISLCCACFACLLMQTACSHTRTRR